MNSDARAALIAVYSERRPDLCRFLAAKLRNQSEGEDLVQELYLRIQTTQLPEQVENPTGFLFTMASNLAFDHVRSSTRRSKRHNDWSDLQYDSIAGQSMSTEPGPEKVLAARQLLAQVERALDDLPSRTGRVFRLHKIKGLSYAEVAREMEISVSTVEKHMIKALQHLLKFRNRNDDH